MKKRTLYYLPPFVAECKKGCVIGSNHIRLMLVYQVRVRDPNLEPRNVIFISTIIHPTDSMLLKKKKTKFSSTIRIPQASNFQG